MVRGREYHGLVYFPLSPGRTKVPNKVGNPFKSSLFGKSVGYEAVQKQVCPFQSRQIRDRKLADMTKRTVLPPSPGHTASEKFVALLKAKGRRCRTALHGRRAHLRGNLHRPPHGLCAERLTLGKEFSANALQEHFTLPYAGLPPIPFTVAVEEPETGKDIP